MKILSAILRVSLFIIGVTILIKYGFSFGSIEAYVGIGFILIALYLAIITQFGIEAVGCPMCKGGSCTIKK